MAEPVAASVQYVVPKSHPPRCYCCYGRSGWGAVKVTVPTAVTGNYTDPHRGFAMRTKKVVAATPHRSGVGALVAVQLVARILRPNPTKPHRGQLLSAALRLIHVSDLDSPAHVSVLVPYFVLQLQLAQRLVAPAGL